MNKLSIKRRSSEPLDLDDGFVYVLRELQGEDSAEYTMARMGFVKMSKEIMDDPEAALKADPELVKGAIRSKAKTDTLLISLCLYRQKEDGEERVTEAEVRQFPSRAIEELVALIEELDKRDEDPKG